MSLTLQECGTCGSNMRGRNVCPGCGARVPKATQSSPIFGFPAFQKGKKPEAMTTPDVVAKVKVTSSPFTRKAAASPTSAKSKSLASPASSSKAALSPSPSPSHSTSSSQPEFFHPNSSVQPVAVADWTSSEREMNKKEAINMLDQILTDCDKVISNDIGWSVLMHQDLMAFRGTLAHFGYALRAHKGDGMFVMRALTRKEKRKLDASTNRALPGSIKQGYLKKKSKKNRHVWNAKYFVLSKEKGPKGMYSFRYYLSKEDAYSDTKRKNMSLVHMSLVEIAIKGKGSADRKRLNLQTSEGVMFELQADHAVDCREWHAAIADAVKKAKEMYWQNMSKDLTNNPIFSAGSVGNTASLSGGGGGGGRR